jgi:Na+-driven multidrug efflux pump
MAVGVMVVFAIACWFGGHWMVSVFSPDADVIAVGAEYLEIVAWTFVFSGVVFTASSMFQALGNTLPPLGASFARILFVAIPAIMMSKMDGFELRWIWYLSVVSVVLQAAIVFWLLQREFRLRLAPFETPLSSATARTH